MRWQCRLDLRRLHRRHRQNQWWVVFAADEGGFLSSRVFVCWLVCYYKYPACQPSRSRIRPFFGVQSRAAVSLRRAGYSIRKGRRTLVNGRYGSQGEIILAGIEWELIHQKLKKTSMLWTVKFSLGSLLQKPNTCWRCTCLGKQLHQQLPDPPSSQKY